MFVYLFTQTTQIYILFDDHASNTCCDVQPYNCADLRYFILKKNNF